MEVFGEKGSVGVAKTLAVARYLGMPLTYNSDKFDPAMAAFAPIMAVRGATMVPGSAAVIAWLARAACAVPEKTVWGKSAASATPKAPGYDTSEAYGDGSVETMSMIDGGVALQIRELDGPAEGRAEDPARIAQMLQSAEGTLTRQQYLVGESLTVADIAFCVSVSELVRRGTVKQADVEALKAVMRLMRAVSSYGDLADFCSFSDKWIAKHDQGGRVLLKDVQFDFDEWKRTYSNQSPASAIKEYFWPKADRARMTLWHMKYDKLEDECKVDFLARNMCAGFLQRLDAQLRKQSFGAVHVSGAAPDYNYSAVWCFIGDQLPQAVADHPSFEYHTFRKLDWEKDQALVEDYWTATETLNFEGKPTPVIDTTIWK